MATCHWRTTSHRKIEQAKASFTRLTGAGCSRRTTRPFLARGWRPRYRGVRRIGDTRDLWSAPAKRSDDGALTVSELRAERAKAGSRFACPRTPKIAGAATECSPSHGPLSRWEI